MNSSSRSGFTLLELLIVVSIIGVLAAMIFPVAQGMVERSHTVACASNLRQLWTALTASATDNDNTFPEIRIGTEDPDVSPEAKGLQETLQGYGITEKMVQCPADMAGPRFFDTEKTSYMWIPTAEEEELQAVKIYGRRRIITAKPSRVRLLEDWGNVHPAQVHGKGKVLNSVYLDGHVKSGAQRL
jgi:prepilin-type N-terminal cleavage/methylation domain-containing protein/prepilin-type processing-associated H-X9-DG protein